MSGEAASGLTLLSEARALTTRTGSLCSVERFFTSHPELAADLREAMAADVPSSAISNALKRRGIELSGETIQRHRRRACKCP